MNANPRENVSPENPAFAHRLYSMIEARLLKYQHYAPWADAVIVRSASPPRWVLDLTLTKYIPKAAEIAHGFAMERAGEGMTLTWDQAVDDFVAATFLRYKRREISWATCLEECGKEADSNGGRNECEYFYSMLTEYEDSNFAEAIELRQNELFLREYSDVVDSVRRTYDGVLAAKPL